MAITGTKNIPHQNTGVANEGAKTLNSSGDHFVSGPTIVY